jgi:hypothetical protein
VTLQKFDYLFFGLYLFINSLIFWTFPISRVGVCFRFWTLILGGDLIPGMTCIPDLRTLVTTHSDHHKSPKKFLFEEPVHWRVHLFTQLKNGGKVIQNWKQMGKPKHYAWEQRYSTPSTMPHVRGRPKAAEPSFPDGVVWIRSRKNMFFHLPAS